MKTLVMYIEAKQKELMDNPFFHELKKTNDLKKLNQYIQKITFWIMTFQDILRLNESRVQDPFWQKILHKHRMENSGYQQWFLHDKKCIEKMCGQDLQMDELSLLYHLDSQHIRDASYAIMAEVYKMEDDDMRVVYLWIIEAAVYVFFEKFAKQVNKIDVTNRLKYFSSSYFDFEVSYEFFEEETKKLLSSKLLSINKRRDGLRLIDRCFKLFNQMFLGLSSTCHGFPMIKNG